MGLVPDLQANTMDLIPEIPCLVVLLLSDFGFRHRYTPFPIGALLKLSPLLPPPSIETPNAEAGPKGLFISLSHPWTSSI